ncbi:MAG: AAA family ATPase [Chlorobium sp.]
MDPICNPFSPGAGSPPPELAGRDALLEQAHILFGRVRRKKPEKSLLMMGLRGVGKTVLLNEMKRMAEQDGYRTIFVEASENKLLAVLLVPLLRTLLFELDRMAGTGNKVRRGLAVLMSFIGAIKVSVGEFDVGLDIDPERGAADSGDLEVDLTNLFIAVGEAAVERNCAVAILIDEIQYLSSLELNALIMAMHKMQQLQLPLALVGAGLPILAGMAGDAKYYAERLFNFPDIGPLEEEDANLALQDPVQKEGVEFEAAALHEIYRLTKGYPYFLQEWGYQVWNQADSSPITLHLVQQTTELVVHRLDKNFFKVRFDRLTDGEKRYLRAMAELGQGPYRTANISELLGVESSATLSPVRSKLIKKGMIYSPAHGLMAFTVPVFDEFMRRSMPL